ncbi:hypothetical protein CCYA_CCYA19G4701 [Cyanidiococcus yangmingshanensis]|nr:hypothetical protein CCYA_CCYA19G4701 [Cyanidiococcus yangmingshanensis]
MREYLLERPGESSECDEFVCAIVCEILYEAVEYDERNGKSRTLVDQLIVDQLCELLIQNARNILSISLRLLESETKDAETESAYRVSLQLLVLLSKNFPTELLLEASVPVRLVLFMRRRVQRTLEDWSASCTDADWLLIEALGNLLNCLEPMAQRPCEEISPLLEEIISLVLHFDEIVCSATEKLSIHENRWEERLYLLQSFVELGVLAAELSSHSAMKDGNSLRPAILIQLRLLSHPSILIAERALSLWNRGQCVRSLIKEEHVPLFLESLWMRHFGDLILSKLIRRSEGTETYTTPSFANFHNKLLGKFADELHEHRKLCLDMKSRAREHLRKLFRQWPDVCISWTLECSWKRMQRFDVQTRALGLTPNSSPFRVSSCVHRIWQELLHGISACVTGDRSPMYWMDAALDATLADMLSTLLDELVRTVPLMLKSSISPAATDIRVSACSAKNDEMSPELERAVAESHQSCEYIWRLVEDAQNLDLIQDAAFFDSLLQFFRGCLPLLTKIHGIKSNFVSLATFLLRRIQSLNDGDKECASFADQNRKKQWSWIVCEGIFIHLSRSDTQEVVEQAQFLLASIHEAQNNLLLSFEARCLLFKCVPLILRCEKFPLDRLGILETTLAEPVYLWNAMAVEHRVLQDPHRFIAAFMSEDENAKNNRACLLQLTTLFEQMLSIEMEGRIWSMTSLCSRVLPSTFPRLIATMNHMYSKQEEFLPRVIRTLARIEDEDMSLHEKPCDVSTRGANETSFVKQATAQDLATELRLWLHRVTTRSLLLFQRVLATGASVNSLEYCSEGCFEGLLNVELHYLAEIGRHVIGPLLRRDIFGVDDRRKLDETENSLWLPLLLAIEKRLEEIAGQKALQEKDLTNDAWSSNLSTYEDYVMTEAAPSLASAMTEVAISLLEQDVRRRSAQLFMWAREFLRKTLDWFYVPSARKAFLYVRKHLNYWTHITDESRNDDVGALLALSQTLARAIDDEGWFDMREEIRKTLSRALLELYQVRPGLELQIGGSSLEPGIESASLRLDWVSAKMTRGSHEFVDRQVSIAGTKLHKIDFADLSAEPSLNKGVPLRVKLKQNWRKQTQLHHMEFDEVGDCGETDAALNAIATLFS